MQAENAVSCCALLLKITDCEIIWKVFQNHMFPLCADMCLGYKRAFAYYISLTTDYCTFNKS